jgi:type IV pilus assembly protein PilY1
MLLVFTGAGGASAQTCEIPLFVQLNATEANVLFIFDSSGSMRSAIYHSAYDGQTVYTGAFDTGNNYSVSNTGAYSPDDFLSNGETTPTAPLVEGENGASGRYRGNYLNWVYYHATDQQRAELPQVTRIEVEKAVLANIVQENAGIRFGVMRLNGDDGGQLVSAVGSDPSDLINDVNAISADGYTPLAETMVDALTYLQDSSASAPIEYACQRTFIILMTDGSPTKDLNVPAYIGDYDGDGREPGTCTSIGAEESNSADCSDYLDDVAAYLYQNDLRNDLDGEQNAVTYTVGFSIDIPLLQETADNGGGLYFTASNAEELQSSLGAIFVDILSRVSSGGGVALISSENSSSNRLYRAKFMPGSWKGYLEAFALPYTDGDAALWEAGALLEARSPSSRTIYTFASGAFRSFDSSNRTEIMPDMNTSDPDYADEIISYVRGEDVTGYRNRVSWKLGDIVESAPVVVGRPAHFNDYLDYSAFAQAYASRETVVYTGANDGMLHCFRASDGYELWSYIPQGALGHIDQIAQPNYCHRFYVNATPKVADVYLNGGWKTVLTCGQGQGGNGYFALDVTDPANPSFLWDVSLNSFDESWTVPEFARGQTCSAIHLA